MKANRLTPAFQKLQEKYIANIPEKLKLLEVYLKDRNREGLAEHFHKFKGNGKTFGFKEISDIAAAVETLHKSNSPSFFQAAEWGITLLSQAYNHILNKKSLDLAISIEYQQLLAAVKNISDKTAQKS